MNPFNPGMRKGNAHMLLLLPSLFPLFGVGSPHFLRQDSLSWVVGFGNWASLRSLFILDNQVNGGRPLPLFCSGRFNAICNAHMQLSQSTVHGYDNNHDVIVSQELLKTFYKTPGVLMIAGLVSWDLVAKKENATGRTHPNLYTFHRFTDRKVSLRLFSVA